jgi:hypothetical protein
MAASPCRRAVQCQAYLASAFPCQIFVEGPKYLAIFMASTVQHFSKTCEERLTRYVSDNLTLLLWWLTNRMQHLSLLTSWSVQKKPVRRLYWEQQWRLLNSPHGVCNRCPIEAQVNGSLPQKKTKKLPGHLLEPMRPWRLRWNTGTGFIWTILIDTTASWSESHQLKWLVQQTVIRIQLYIGTPYHRRLGTGF